MLMLLTGDHTLQTTVIEEEMAGHSGITSESYRIVYGPQPFSISRGDQTL